MKNTRPSLQRPSSWPPPGEPVTWHEQIFTSIEWSPENQTPLQHGALKGCPMSYLSCPFFGGNHSINSEMTPIWVLVREKNVNRKCWPQLLASSYLIMHQFFSTNKLETQGSHSNLLFKCWWSVFIFDSQSHSTIIWYIYIYIHVIQYKYIPLTCLI